jgi:hypothetical protein
MSFLEYLKIPGKQRSISYSLLADDAELSTARELECGVAAPATRKPGPPAAPVSAWAQASDVARVRRMLRPGPRCNRR